MRDSRFAKKAKIAESQPFDQERFAHGLTWLAVSDTPAAMSEKSDYLKEAVAHLDISLYNVVPLVRAMRQTGLAARDLACAADIYDTMLCDHACAIILCLSGPLVGVGLKKVFADAIQYNMADAIVAAEATIIDQDFFEALGFHHYLAAEPFRTGSRDAALRQLDIDRIGDTLIDAQQLRIRDETLKTIARQMPPGEYSSRQLICRMGAYLDEQEQKPADSIIYEAYKAGVPIFCPPPSQSPPSAAAGFRAVAHQVAGKEQTAVFEAAKDFRELARMEDEADGVGLLTIGGAAREFVRNLDTSAKGLGIDLQTPRYAIQLAVADARDGGRAQNTLREAAGPDRLDPCQQQTLYTEASLAVPLVFGYAYHLAHWLGRSRRNYNRLLDERVV